jgi:glycosyltransferase involved in cell wall biosynthesis
MVNDASKDRSYEMMQEFAASDPRIHIAQHEKNSGKSQTIKKGLAMTTGRYVVIQDADLEYEPADIPALLEKIKSGYDLVYGNRFSKKNEVVYFQNWIGNTVLSIFSGIITGLRAGMWPRDMEVGYKMAKGDLFREIGAKIEATTLFGLEPEMTARFSKIKGIKFAQVPIHYYPRTVAEGKKMQAFKHGWEALQEIIRYNFLRK